MVEQLFRHIKFRYTFKFHDILDEPGAVEAMGEIASTFIEKFDCLYVTCGLEDLDKFGEKTHPHIHIHAVTHKKVDALRKAVNKIFKEMEEDRKGNCLYSLTEVKDILDENRLLRYPLKQSRRGFGDIAVLRELYKLPDNYEYDTQRECAIEEWERLVLVNRQKRERSLNPNTFEKFEEYMTEKDEVKTTAEVAGHIHDFYLKEKMSMNLKTMGGYVRTFSVQHGIISRSENISKILENV